MTHFSCKLFHSNISVVKSNASRVFSLFGFPY